MMEQFQFTGDTPALYYAQAAWEFKHNNAAKANDWIVSARKIYSPALNFVFADSFYDLGWLQNPSTAPATASTETAKGEATPSIEPSPIAAAVVASNESAKQPNEIVAQKSPATVAGMEATTANTAQPPSNSQTLIAKNEEVATAPAASPKVETPVVSNALPAETRAPLPREPEQSLATGPATSAVVAQQSAANSPPNKVAAPIVAPSTAATVLAPATVQEWSQTTVSERMDRFTNSRTLLVGALLLAGIVLLTWVVISELRRRVSVSVYRSPAPAMGPRFDAVERETTAEKIAAPSRLEGGPPQISLQLKASEPSVRRAAVPFGKVSRPFGAGAIGAAGNGPVVENFVPQEMAPIQEPEQVDEPAGQPITESAPAPFTAADSQSAGDLTPASLSEIPVLASAPEWEFAPVRTETASIYEDAAPAPQETSMFAETSAALDAAATFEALAPVEAVTEPATFETAEFFETVGEPISMPSEIASESVVTPAAESSGAEMEPVAQGQPIPYQVPAFSTDSPMAEITKPEPESLPTHLPSGAIAGVGGLRHSVESPSFVPQVISTEPLAQQPTTPATMPQPIQPTPAPAIRTAPMTGGAPQPQSASGMHTSVQLTFSFEIASMQLTPSFKMGALQLKPTSKIVTMRLAPSQQPQPAMNLQVTFEIATVQLAGNSIGMIRLTPSQQQRPSVISSPSFNVAGLQLLSGAESGAVQITPSQQGQASVHVTSRFQIATVEFSPSFEIASIVLNSASKNVSVQLPGAGPSAVEGAPVFEITNVQLAGNGEIGIMQLSAQGAAPKPA